MEMNFLNSKSTNVRSYFWRMLLLTRFRCTAAPQRQSVVHNFSRSWRVLRCLIRKNHYRPILLHCLLVLAWYARIPIGYTFLLAGNRFIAWAYITQLRCLVGSARCWFWEPDGCSRIVHRKSWKLFSMVAAINWAPLINDKNFQI